MPSSSDPRNLRAKWQRALEERRKAGAVAPPVDVTPRAPARGRRGEAGEKGDLSVRDPGADAPVERMPRGDAPPDAPVGRAPRGDSLTDDVPAPAAREPSGNPSGGARPSAIKPSAIKVSPVPGAPAGTAKKKRADGEDDAEGEGTAKKASPATSVWSSIGAAVMLVGGVGLALRTFISADEPKPPPPEDETAESTTGASGTGALVPPEKPKIPGRCTPSAKEPFVVGDAHAPKTAPAGDDALDSPEDDLAPFAVQLGRGVRYSGGFAVGSQRQAEGGTVSMIATLSEDGAGKLVRLARSRGDFDPPVVAAAGDAILAAMMEPNAGGRAIRIAKIEGDRVTWGPELSENNDESFAVDIETSGSRALVVWDDVPLGRERSVIELATFDVETMRGSGGRAITPPSVDADTPQLIARPGGFWLSYLVHGVAKTAPTAEGEEEPEDAAPPGKSPAKKGKRNADDSDTEAAGEAIAHQWIELLPLDKDGFSAGAARPVTPKDSRVIGYDLASGEDGRAVILYREDDTPSGSHGGRVKAVIAELGGIGDPQVIAEEGVGAGVPMLFGGWVVIHSLSGPVQLGAIGPKGELVGELSPETALKQGEILAADGEAFLVAAPAGRAMKLSIAKCVR